MKKLLIIVDPQVDFITGTLPVPGAVDAMDRLAAFVRDDGESYSHIIVTADRHPFGHCSFVESGGEWPRHCVGDSVGAAIWPELMDALYDYPGPVTILHKGESADCDEYSVFRSASAGKINEIIRNERPDKIDICGLAGDVCVAETLADGVAAYGDGVFTLLPQFSPTIS